MGVRVMLLSLTKTQGFYCDQYPFVLDSHCLQRVLRCDCQLLLLLLLWEQHGATGTTHVATISRYKREQRPQARGSQEGLRAFFVFGAILVARSQKTLWGMMNQHLQGDKTDTHDQYTFRTCVAAQNVPGHSRRDHR